MKRGMRWSDSEDDDTTSSDEENSSSLNTKKKSTKKYTNQSSKSKASTDSSKKKQKNIGFEALHQHGYKGGLSILGVPQPKQPEQEQNWSWSSGKETRLKEGEKDESFQERQKTRAALADGEELVGVLTSKEKRNISFQQKEKRKRDLGQTSRGKNYVEEEKRLLRDNGVYSGFDS